jgi:hypothetical protein
VKGFVAGRQGFIFVDKYLGIQKAFSMLIGPQPFFPVACSSLLPFLMPIQICAGAINSLPEECMLLATASWAYSFVVLGNNHAVSIRHDIDHLHENICLHKHVTIGCLLVHNN